MAPNGKPLSYKEHHDLGGELRLSHRRLVELRFLADSIYGNDSSVSAAFTQAADAVLHLLREMQIQAATDCPDLRADDFYR